jgi:hypothetical protein
MKTYKTTKGTELPIANLKGKDYLEIKYRILWFHEEHPDWTIETSAIQITDSSATMKACIKDDTGRIRGTGHGTETVEGFHNFVEKAETAAMGRALATIGYGTQFAVDLEEGAKLADAPVADKSHRTSDEYVIQVGKKYRGKRLADVPADEIKNYVAWLERSSKETGKPLSRDAVEFVSQASSFLNTQNLQKAS